LYVAMDPAEMPGGTEVGVYQLVKVSRVRKTTSLEDVPNRRVKR
jgi:hypothetical protein